MKKQFSEFCVFKMSTVVRLASDYVNLVLTVETKVTTPSAQNLQQSRLY